MLAHLKKVFFGTPYYAPKNSSTSYKKYNPPVLWQKVALSLHLCVLLQWNCTFAVNPAGISHQIPFSHAPLAIYNSSLTCTLRPVLRLSDVAGSGIWTVLQWTVLEPPPHVCNCRHCNPMAASTYGVTQKKWRFWAKICSRCWIWLFRMCFGIRISSPIHLTTLTIPIQNQKYLKNAKKTHPRTTISPLPFEVQPRLCRLYKCIHRQPKPNLCLPALLSKHHGRTV